MKMTAEQYQLHREEYDGYCIECNDITNYGEVEPDAMEYECEDCGENSVMGMCNALMCDYIEFVEDEE